MLSLRYEEMPPGMDRYFGTIYYDEVHHVSAPLFSNTAPLFYGERHGLTATVSREDGLEAIYQYHIGQVYHRDLSQDLVPRIYFQQHPVQLNWRSAEVQDAVYDKRGQLNIPKLRSYLGTLPECNEFLATLISRTLDAGRKVLALSHSVDQLRALNEMFDDSGLCTGREKPKARIETLRAKRLTFGTLQLVKEALDEDTLDTLFFLTPFGSSTIDDGGVNTLQQGMGRIQRFRPGKKTPLVFIIDYLYIPKFHKMCNRLKRQLRNWSDEQGGPLDYKVLRPQTKENING
jgi:superfamily II DNA or RNA helicase